MKATTYAPFAKPLYVMVKPVGAVCNLACEYCYYLEKANLYKENPKHVMSDELLEKFIDEYINSQTMPQVLFTWHGGETLMRPLSFYKKAMELQKKYARGRTIDNCIQTNGTLLTDEWCEFFRENNWLVGVSIDGPQEFHDEYRKNKMGKPSFVKVMQGINLLKKHGVEWNAMAVVNDFNAEYPLDFYNFFKEIDCHYIQFAPIVERIVSHQDGRHLASLAEGKEGALADFSVSPGDVTCIIGPSGSGKSTLLRCLNMLETPSTGEINYHGTDITSKNVNVPEYRSKVGMVFQNFHLFNNMTALKNCTVGQVKVLKKSKEEAEKKALYYLEKVGMAPYINAKPKQLSGGQKQRVAIARALAMEPEILLFDEPTSALDPQMVGEVLEVMRDLAHEGLTMIIVTHEMAFARDVSKRVIFMANGVIVEDRPPKELFENPKDPLTKDFLSRFRNA